MTIRSQFHHMLALYYQHTGIHMPEALHWYVCDLLVDRLNRVDIIPDPSFGERYLALYSELDLGQFKDYADSALFFCSLMPEYGSRRGLDMSYYATLGISTYYSLGDLAEDPRYTQLGNWFYHLQRILQGALHQDRSVRFSDDLHF